MHLRNIFQHAVQRCLSRECIYTMVYWNNSFGKISKYFTSVLRPVLKFRPKTVAHSKEIVIACFRINFIGISLIYIFSAKTSGRKHFEIRKHTYLLPYPVSDKCLQAVRFWQKISCWGDHINATRTRIFKHWRIKLFHPNNKNSNVA